MVSIKQNSLPFVASTYHNITTTKNSNIIHHIDEIKKDDHAYDGDSESSQAYHSSEVFMFSGQKQLLELNSLKENALFNTKTVSKIQSSFVALSIPAVVQLEDFAPNGPEFPKKFDFNDTVPCKFPAFPEEKWKTVLAALIAVLSFICTLTSLVLTHERLPDKDRNAPLPDIVLDNVLPFDWALDVSEYIIIVSVNSAFIILLFHKHRFIVFRRLLLILAVLYFYRAITMYVTILPIANRTYNCAPKTHNMNIIELARRVFRLMSGLGLSINGKHIYCGDFIFSGHTVSLVMSYLAITEYTSDKFWFLHWVYWFLAALGIVFLEFAHGHYTIDVVIAYYITTRVFWTYHALANNGELKNSTKWNYYRREWWYHSFMYFEQNIDAPLPNEFEWPFWKS